MEIPQNFSSAETDAAAAALFEQQQRQLQKYQTRYVYLPFQDGICAQIPGGYVPAGAIHPIPAPKGKISPKLLPEGAEILQLVSPSTGVPVVGKPVAPDDELGKLRQEIEELKRKQDQPAQEPASVAIYLHEVAPIVGNVTSLYAREGGIEVKTLFDVKMPDATFEKYRMNDLLFGPEGERPSTAKAIQDRMLKVIEQAKGQKGEGARILGAVAGEILKSVEQCARFCSEHVRQRHLEMQDPQNDAPKRYSRRDLRAIDFVGAVKREEYLQHAAERQEQAMTAIPELMAEMNRRDQQWAQLFGEMTKALSAQTEALKTLSNKSGK